MFVEMDPKISGCGIVRRQLIHCRQFKPSFGNVNWYSSYLQESSNSPSFALCSNGTVNLPPHLYLSKLCLFFHSQSILEYSHSFSYIALDCSHLGTFLAILSLKYRQPIPFLVPRKYSTGPGIEEVWSMCDAFIESLVRMVAQVPLFFKNHSGL